MQETSKTSVNLFLRSQGIDASKYDASFLERSLQKRIAETHCDTVEAYFTFAEKNEQEGVHLVTSLNINYSEFFRNPLTFAVLERIVLPSIALKKENSRRNEIRIWSAACAAGQETYSLAILLEELKKDINEKINFRIFATDQSHSQIITATKGQYGAAALNNLSLKRVNKWFVSSGQSYTVREELKKNIEFSVFDLFCDQFSCPPTSIFGDFDLVVCANLLFYYDPVYQEKILGKVENCLAQEGYVITGETERDILIRQNYREVFPQSAIFRMGHK